MQRLRRLFSRDKPPLPTPQAVREELVQKLSANGCQVLDATAAQAVVDKAQQQAMIAVLEESATPRGQNGSTRQRCHVPQLNTYIIHMSAVAPDVDGTAREMARSWRHGKEIMTPEVAPSPSREHLVVTYRCVLTPKSEDTSTSDDSKD